MPSIKFAFSSDDYNHRKVGASLVGFLRGGHDLLRDLYLQEKKRDADTDDLMARLYSQSVVEDIVFAAARLARDEDARPASLDFLDTFVREVLAGCYWNTATYAMTTLMYHDTQEYSALLTDYLSYLDTAKVDHPSNPDLSREKAAALSLSTGDKNALNMIEGHLAQKDAACTAANLQDQDQATIDALIAAAARY